VQNNWTEYGKGQRDQAVASVGGRTTKREMSFFNHDEKRLCRNWLIHRTIRRYRLSNKKIVVGSGDPEEQANSSASLTLF